MFQLSSTISPSPRIIGASFGSIARGFRGYRRPLEESVRRVAIPAIIENFEVGGRPPWTPHAASTIERRSRQGTLGGAPQDILIETGQGFGDVIRLARWTITRDEAFISNLPDRSAYMRFHQTGADLARGGFMPARPWAQMSTQEVDEVQDIFQEWRNDIIARSLWRRVIARFL